MNVSRKTRKRPVYNRLRQFNWLMWRVVSEHKCCFCDKLLFEGFDPKKVNVTVHHIKGNIHTDNRNAPAPISEQLFAHASCHKAFHHMERMHEKGNSVDIQRLKFMRKTVKQHERLNARLLGR